jgi:hypothetical protein
VIPGERAEVLARERWTRLCPLDAYALAAVVLAAAPLAAALGIWGVH